MLNNLLCTDFFFIFLMYTAFEMFASPDIAFQLKIGIISYKKQSVMISESFKKCMFIYGFEITLF